ncbi:tRNA (N6-isopentenyl adenosine(37)-C2)-methylthiotransferase MiaB [Gimesia aquarii]|uniref:tRNA-2-methylthio-N(6)-dimethylallyladenosine synthase n=1 Tax=Gimesia aquarii TaxID=2527964 RepID=A0A517VWT3_9PLAN|nr:tRNA (N6-isopentenyl adenosine(37)-C2)-methylthiotransferase MiaB [Gimesia aquarii]QDT97466.1 tRNA-2-methylthio-N(6)-dimethylallyladenosine synthase [Gimesia aquarii]
MSHVDQTNDHAAEPLPVSDTAVDSEVLTDHNHKLYIETVGCQMNMLDSELVVADLRKRGYELTKDVKEAETILFNTCSVREHAEHKIYSSLGRLRYGARKNPKKVIGVMGCMAQKDQKLIFQKAPQVDFVVGTGQLAQVSSLIDKARIHHSQNQRSRELAVGLGRKDGKHTEITNSFQSYDPLRDPEMRPSPFQAFVRIMIGCDKFCSYCVVPSTRGPEQSRSPREIASEVRVLADQGVKEVTLLGQTVNSYKHTQDGKLFRLSDLLYLIHDIEGIDRIKFVTSYPKDMTNDLLEAIRDLPKATRYLHVPLQHGCNDVLKYMKRGYTVEDYRDMMQRINEILPGCSVSSDFIVGHPGETEESHQKSLESIREFRFKNSFIFKYSERPGTKAAERFSDDIPDDVKKRRNNEMLKLQNEISEEDNAEFIGRQVEVLVEGPSKSAQKVTEDSNESLAEQLMGRSNCDRIVVFDGNPRLAGSLAQVEVFDVTPTTLIGSIVTKEYQHNPGSSLPILQ